MRRARMRALALLMAVSVAVALGGCATETGPSASELKARWDAENVYPQGYRQDLLAFLRTYLKRHRYGWGTTRGLVETLDQLTGGNWQPWFERYVYGTEIPQLPK